MKYIFLILFVSCHFIAYNQVVKGVVIDKNNEENIPFATIYINGTSLGTSSGINGNFKLDITRFALHQLTVSAIGYYSETIGDLLLDEQLVIKLRPKVYDIPPAVINSKSLVRQRRVNLRIFRNEFIGETENSWQCKILNEDDITFNYYQDDDTLKAFASKPIIIKNEALGYNITYFLEKFEYYRNTRYTYFAGNFIFEEDSTLDKELIKKNRKDAYYGSRMHFFRSLWANELKSNNFSIKNSQGRALSYNDIVVQDNDGNKFLKNEGHLMIYHFLKETELILSVKLLYFDQDGNFGSQGILWNGDMSVYRIADWLPLEFEVE